MRKLDKSLAQTIVGQNPSQSAVASERHPKHHTVRGGGRWRRETLKLKCALGVKVL